MPLYLGSGVRDRNPLKAGFGVLCRHRAPVTNAPQRSSEVETGSHEENAPNQKHRAPLLIPSEAERL
jgi:hypothetical protein